VRNSRTLLKKLADERAKAIRKYITDNPKCATGNTIIAYQHNTTEKIKVYSLPRHLLRLNPGNGRFKAELEVIHEDRKNAGKPLELDPSLPEDVKILRDMLKGKYPKNAERENAYKKLYDDILQISMLINNNGQEVPGMITYDGTYVNGNRRDTVMEDLSETTKKRKGQPLKYNEISVGILSKDVTPYELWKNEAREQISQESREEYDYVNSALEVKVGYDMLADKKFSHKKIIEELSTSFFGRSAEDIENYLTFLKTADQFLKLVKRPGQYRYIQESGNESGEKGIVTILQEAGKIQNKLKEDEDWDGESLNKWFKSMSIFCICSKNKPMVPNSKGKSQKLSFGHREFRNFQKKAMSTAETRKKVFSSPVLDKIDWLHPSNDDALRFHQDVSNAQALYDIKEEITTPLMLLEKASESLSQVSQDLNSSKRAIMVKAIKKEKGERFISEIKKLITDISKKLKTK